ncbi:MAG: 2-C-methyl-D-erythritol 2,4-cyclodiphosphate synthase [Acidobacteriota bacterium]|nr:2-C-methyl-D-erythritol 2,4-cyclodiphosphate synthase [Acidobacteriota bacterium]
MTDGFRVGLGFDFHPFGQDRRLLLGGVRIPHPLGLRGHSDADALLHAVIDALLGAAGLRDIGTWFPDTDPAYRDSSSRVLLQKAYGRVRDKGFALVNLDITVLAEAPRIQPHVDAMKANLARLLSVETGRIGLKATTMEGCGPIGRGEGIAVQAVVLLVRSQREA